MKNDSDEEPQIYIPYADFVSLISPDPENNPDFLQMEILDCFKLALLAISKKEKSSRPSPSRKELSKLYYRALLNILFAGSGAPIDRRHLYDAHPGNPHPRSWN